MKLLVALLLVAALGRADAQGTNTNGPDLTVPMLTREQAETQLPPPVKIVDLSKPGNVYKSSDPLVAAAVADYLSKIKEPHDQFGNIITKNYKSATLPDTVDSKVIAAIVAFVGNQRFIALSPRAAQSLAATQHIQRQKDIDKIIYDDWANKVRAKARNTNGNGGGGGGGGGDGAGPGGGNANNPGPPVGGGNENVPNLNNNNGNTNQPPSQGGIASQIAAEFNVVVSPDPQPWTDAELTNLRDVLARLPRNFYKGAIFKRQAVLSIDGKPSPTLSSDYDPSGTNSGTITMSNYYQSDENGTRMDNWPTPPWPEGEAKSLHLRAHLARNILYNFLNYGGGRAQSLGENPLTQDFASTFGWTFNSATSRWSFPPTRRAERITQQAIGTPTDPAAPFVDMAESVAFYLFDPARLKATSADGRSRFNWIRDKLGFPAGPEDPNKTAPTLASRNIGN